MIFLYKRCCSKTRSIFYSLKQFFFGLALSTTLCLHSRQIWGTKRPSNLSSALFKDSYLNLLLHTKNVVKRGWAGQKIRLKKRIEYFFQSLTWLTFLLLSSYSTVYKLSLTVATKLVQSPKLFKLNDAQRGLASAKKNGWQNKLRNRSTSPKLRKTVSIPEVILQLTFSRTLTSLSKQKRLNAHDHNSATGYFDDKTSGAFYSWELTQPRGANNSILKICRTTYLFPEPVTYIFGRAKRAPHWGVQSRFRVIYVGMSRMSN